MAMQSVPPNQEPLNFTNPILSNHRRHSCRGGVNIYGMLPIYSMLGGKERENSFEYQNKIILSYSRRYQRLKRESERDDPSAQSRAERTIP